MKVAEPAASSNEIKIKVEKEDVLAQAVEAVAVLPLGSLFKDLGL